MARNKTVVVKEVYVVDEDETPIDTDGKRMEDLDRAIKDGRKQQTLKQEFYLLHFGLVSEVFYDSENNPIPTSYTVAICQDIKTGRIFNLSPVDLTVIGMEVR